MNTLVAVVVLAAAPRVAVLDFQGVNVDKELLSFCTTTFATRLAEGDALLVTTSADLSNALGLERQRQLLGCSPEGGACMAELAGALGVSAIAAGSLAKLGDRYQLTLRSTDASGRPVVALTDDGVEAQLPDMLMRASAALRRGLLGGLRSEGGVASSARGAPSPAPVVLAAIGGGLALTGAVLWAIAGGTYGQLVDPRAPSQFDDAEAARRAAGAKALQVGALSLLAAGVAAGIAGAIWAALQPKATAWLGVEVDAARASAVVAWRWP